jgi:hypothetical protein
MTQKEQLEITPQELLEKYESNIRVLEQQLQDYQEDLVDYAEQKELYSIMFERAMQDFTLVKPTWRYETDEVYLDAWKKLKAKTQQDKLSQFDGQMVATEQRIKETKEAIARFQELKEELKDE